MCSPIYLHLQVIPGRMEYPEKAASTAKATCHLRFRCVLMPSRLKLVWCVPAFHLNVAAYSSPNQAGPAVQYASGLTLATAVRITLAMLHPVLKLLRAFLSTWRTVPGGAWPSICLMLQRIKHMSPSTSKQVVELVKTQEQLHCNSPCSHLCVALDVRAPSALWADRS